MYNGRSREGQQGRGRAMHGCAPASARGFVVKGRGRMKLQENGKESVRCRASASCAAPWAASVTCGPHAQSEGGGVHGSRSSAAATCGPAGGRGTAALSHAVSWIRTCSIACTWLHGDCPPGQHPGAPPPPAMPLPLPLPGQPHAPVAPAAAGTQRSGGSPGSWGGCRRTAAACPGGRCLGQGKTTNRKKTVGNMIGGCAAARRRLRTATQQQRAHAAQPRPRRSPRRPRTRAAGAPLEAVLAGERAPAPVGLLDIQEDVGQQVLQDEARLGPGGAQILQSGGSRRGRGGQGGGGRAVQGWRSAAGAHSWRLRAAGVPPGPCRPKRVQSSVRRACSVTSRCASVSSSGKYSRLLMLQE